MKNPVSFAGINPINCFSSLEITLKRSKVQHFVRFLLFADATSINWLFSKMFCKKDENWRTNIYSNW